MLSEKLKLKTKEQHQQLEVKIVGTIKAIRQQRDYVKLLQIFAGYFGALEFLINQTLRSDMLPDFSSRRKAVALKTDLLNMSASLPQKIRNENLPIIINYLHALGALYVMEGSTLGGQVITKMIASKLPDEKAFSFFQGYGEKTIEMWNSFKESINAMNLTKEEEGIIITSANETFQKFCLYFDLVNAD
ncbi:MAG: biliverdin-producing heme oxygenase [Ferruginibacter sp.]